KLEPCNTFSFRYRTEDACVKLAKRKCLHFYYYFMEPELGLVHVQVQSWFPLRVQVFLNGHDWLASKLDAAGIGYRQCDNVFVWIEDVKRAQRFCDRMSSLDWPSILNGLAQRVNPLMGTLLGRMQYYWVTAQCEYATDVMFKKPSDLKELYGSSDLFRRALNISLARLTTGSFASCANGPSPKPASSRTVSPLVASNSSPTWIG